MSNYQNIYENLNVLSQLQLPSDGRSWRTMHKRDTSIESLSTFEHGLSIFLDSLIKAQNALAHSLTYVHKAEGSVADHKQGIFKRAITKVSKVIERTANESITKRASSNSLQPLILFHSVQQSLDKDHGGSSNLFSGILVYSIVFFCNRHIVQI